MIDLRRVHHRHYPNPARDILTIEITEHLTTLPEIFTATGQLISVSTTIKSAQYLLNVASLDSGFYLVKLTTKSGSHLRKVIVSE